MKKKGQPRSLGWGTERHEKWRNLGGNLRFRLAPETADAGVGDRDRAFPVFILDLRSNRFSTAFKRDVKFQSNENITSDAYKGAENISFQVGKV